MILNPFYLISEVKATGGCRPGRSRKVGEQLFLINFYFIVAIKVSFRINTLLRNYFKICMLTFVLINSVFLTHCHFADDKVLLTDTLNSMLDVVFLKEQV